MPVSKLNFRKKVKKSLAYLFITFGSSDLKTPQKVSRSMARKLIEALAVPRKNLCLLNSIKLHHPGEFQNNNNLKTPAVLSRIIWVTLFPSLQVLRTVEGSKPSANNLNVEDPQDLFLCLQIESSQNFHTNVLLIQMK